jgi:flavin reductase (DIM6/NTAB) family NADH-FMN oxidoreductase RutF
MECKVTNMFEPGNHTLFVGKVLSAKIFSHETPLTTLDYEGFYVGDH